MSSGLVFGFATIGVDPADPNAPPYIDNRLELPAVYKARQVTTREIASSGGCYEAGDVKVGPITPAYTAADGIEIIYELVGAHAGEYSLLGLVSAAPFGWWVVLGRRQTTA